MTTDLTALDAANKALQGSPTVAKATKDFGAAATAAIHSLAGGAPPPPPPPPAGRVRILYNSNPASQRAADWAIQEPLGFTGLVCDTTDLALLAAQAKQGCKSWAAPGYWTGSGFSRTDAETVAECKAAWATGAVHAFYLADEPKTGAAIIKARSDLIKSAVPGARTVMSTWDTGIVASFAHVTDYVALDGYPNQTALMKNGQLDLSFIAAQAHAADLAAWPYFGVVGAFGRSSGGLYTLPTAAGLKSMIAAWAATNQLGYAVYSWGAEVSVSDPADYLEAHKDLLAVLQAANLS